MPEYPWLEVSLIVDGELAEAAAEVLARFAPNGVAIESTGVTAGPDDSQGRAVGPLRVAAYLPVDENLEDARSRLEESLWYLGRIHPLPEAQYRFIEEANWAEAWKQHYRPITIGRRLVIVPAWLESPDPGRLPIRIDPGMAFGTGTHPTTQLCLELLETFYLDLLPGHNAPMIDVGCGSGILAIAALKLGAPYALGVDIDQEAVRAARENALLNQVDDHLELGQGSLTDIIGDHFSFKRGGLVTANILAPVLSELLDEGLGELLLPGGWLVLSGILEDQSEQVEQAVTRNGLRLVSRLQSGDWVALAACAA